MEVPEDIWSWLVGGTALDVKMLLASLLMDGADLDSDDIDQVIRDVIVDAVYDGLTKKQMLLGLVLRETPKAEDEIHPHFFEAFQPALTSLLRLKVSPLNLHPDASRAIGLTCQKLFDAVSLELGLVCIFATNRDAFRKRYIEPPT